MKGLRHARIKEFIENQVIETQEELADILKKEGIEITQATVSRDIKELMLIKVPVGDGRYRYAFPQEPNAFFSQSRTARVFQDSVVAIDYSENIVVLKTLPGMAQAVAATVDNSRWPEILGTVAGDDTIFIVVKPVEAVPALIHKFQEWLLP